MTRVPHGFWLANLAVVWAALFTAWALFVLPGAIALVAAAALTPVTQKSPCSRAERGCRVAPWAAAPPSRC